ncbi:MAG: ABC transporter ATP-binding protein [Cellulosilyticum sp.]|nr:ABC transporter ATP-binding protein [Cellulosilyticum sp.]
MSEVAIRIDGLKKQYRLGTISAGTLRGDIQSWWARKRGKEDPNSIIGEKQRIVGEKLWALNGVTFEVKKGEAVGIIGMNGAGKSTLLKILSRVTSPTEGEVEIHGRVSSMLEVGTGFHPELTGRENIYLNGAILGMSRKEVDSKMADIIEFSECGDFIDTPVKRYSSGMYVKLAFSVAAHLDADIMIMDEVLAVGDMKFQQKCLGKMGDSAEKDGKTVLYVSHNMNTIRQLCTRCIVLNQGQVIFDGDTEKAIEMYVGAFDVSENTVTLDDMERREEFKGNKVTMSKLEMLDGKNGHYTVGDKMELILTTYSEHDIDKYFTRAIIKHVNGDGVTMMKTAGDHSYKVGDNKRKMNIDISMLAPGSYTLSFVQFEVNDYGTDGYLDGLHNVYTFVVEPSMDFNAKMEWKSKYWGYVVGKDIVEEDVM